MSNLPDRLGDSDTSALLKHGRAYGVAAAIAVGAIAYMSGGISGVEMGGAVAATPAVVATATPFYLQTGPNLPAGMDLWYALDPTQSDQSVLNTQEQVNGFNPGRAWTVAGADSGAFFNQTSGDTTVVDFVWASGDKEYVAQMELAVDTMCSSYARTTVRYDADWQWSGGTIKVLWWQENPMNAATGFYSSGRPSLVNVNWSKTSPTSVVAGEWADVETYYKYMGTDSSELKIWLDGTLVVDSVGFSYANGTPATRLALKPWHGGADLKTQVDTFSYSRSVVYGTAGPC